jgi:predicted GTPase
MSGVEPFVGLASSLALRAIQSSMGLESTDSAMTKRILVFGSTNTGKTSLINILTGSNAPTGNDAAGVTDKASTTRVSYNNREYCFIHTVGLNEAKSGTVPHSVAMQKLFELLTNLKSGLNLMVMVIKSGSRVDTTDANYEVFVKRLAEEKVPLVIVVSNCESEREMKTWVDRNHAIYQDLNYKAMVSWIQQGCHERIGPIVIISLTTIDVAIALE